MPWENRRDQYRRGGFWRIDDRTGRKVRGWKTTKETTGLIVADADQEPHPQDLIRGRPDYRSQRKPAPEPTDDFLTANEVTRESL